MKPGIFTYTVTLHRGSSEVATVDLTAHNEDEARTAAATIAAENGATVASVTALCHWFAKCDRPAVATQAHPIGDVPICDVHREWVNRHTTH